MPFTSSGLTCSLPQAYVSAIVEAGTGSALAAPLPIVAGAIETAWEVALISPQVVVDSTAATQWDIALTVPSTTTTAECLVGGLFSGSLIPTLPASVTATGGEEVVLTGKTFDCALYPLAPTVSGTCRPAPVADLTAPLATVAGTMYAEIVWTAAITVPQVELYSSASAVVSTTFDTWVLNTRNNGASSYDNYPFKNYFRYAGDTYGCAADGIYKLTGDTDAGDPIDAHTLHGVSDFGSDYLKRIDSAYLNIRGDGEVIASMRVDEFEERGYYATPVEQGLRTLRVKFGRALNGRNWQLGIRNVGGSRFLLTGVKVSPIKLSRRI